VGRGAGAPERPRRPAPRGGAPLGDRFEGVTLLREDGSPTYQLATVVDDIDFGITHIVRGNDHRPNEAVHRRLFEALGATPPEFVHHGLILGDDGRKLSKRAAGATVASLREDGFPRRPYARTSRSSAAEARRPPRPPRLRRLSIEALGELSDDELAAASAFPSPSRRAARRARSSSRRGEYATLVLEPPPRRSTRPRRSRASASSSRRAADPKSVVRELKAVGGDLKALRLALTGAERGPELAAVIAALPPDELLRRTVGWTNAASTTRLPAARRAAAAARPDRDLLVRPTVYQRIHVGNALAVSSSRCGSSAGSSTAATR
jgi:hypothetical protein